MHEQFYCVLERPSVDRKIHGVVL